MTTRLDIRLTHALRQHDAADHELDDGQRERAAATFQRIVGSDPDAGRDLEPAARPRRHRRRPLLLAGGVVAASLIVLAVPLVTGAGEVFASWTPTPVQLVGADRQEAVDACLTLQGSERSELAFDADAVATVLVAEARGGWKYVLFTVPGSAGRPLQASCLMPDALVGEPRPGEGGFFGSLGGANETAGSPPGRAAVREDSYGAGTVDDEAFVYVEGRVGSDVVGIEVTTPTGREVEASVENGHWAAWWPAGDASMDNPELSGAPTYQVTLRGQADATDGAAR